MRGAGRDAGGASSSTTPTGYFVPPYVGHRGWLGVRLDRGLSWDEVAGAIEDAYAVVAPERLVDAGGRAQGRARSRRLAAAMTTAHTATARPAATSACHT